MVEAGKSEFGGLASDFAALAFGLVVMIVIATRMYPRLTI